MGLEADMSFVFHLDIGEIELCGWNKNWSLSDFCSIANAIVEHCNARQV